MKKFYTPNHKLYEEYYLNQAKRKGGNLLAFHVARFQRGYGLGSIFKGLFRWALPHLQQGAKVLGKKALQTGVQVAQDVLAGENVKTATKKRAKQALGLPSQISSQLVTQSVITEAILYDRKVKVAPSAALGHAVALK